MSTAIAPVEITPDMETIMRHAQEWCHNLHALTETACRNKGICNVSTSALPSGHSWVLCLILSDEVRLLELQSADARLLGGLKMDLETWIAGRQHAGTVTTYRDCVAYLADTLYGDAGGEIVTKFEVEGKL